MAIPLSQERGIRILDLNTHAEKQIATANRCLGWPPRSTVPFWLGNRFRVYLFRLNDTSERRRFKGHNGGVTAVDFSADGRSMASTGKDGTIRLGKMTPGRSVRVIPRDKAIGQSVAYSPNGHGWPLPITTTVASTFIPLQTVKKYWFSVTAPPNRELSGASALVLMAARLAAVGSPGFRLWSLNLHELFQTTHSGEFARHGFRFFRNVTFLKNRRAVAFVGTVSGARTTNTLIFEDWRANDPRIEVGGPTDSLVQSLP